MLLQEKGAATLQPFAKTLIVLPPHSEAFAMAAYANRHHIKSTDARHHVTTGRRAVWCDDGVVISPNSLRAQDSVVGNGYGRQGRTT